MPSEPLDKREAVVTFRVEATQIHRNRLLMALAVLPFLALPVLWLAAILDEPGLVIFTAPVGALGAVASSLVWRNNPWRRERRVKIEVDGEALWIGERCVPKDRIKRGLHTRVAGKNEVWLSRGGLAPDLALVMTTAKQARALLAALGLDASQSVAAFSARSSIHEGRWRPIVALFAVVGPTIVLAALAAFLGAPFAVAVVLVGVLAAFALFQVPTRVEVGADGVMITWLGTRRFVSHGDIEGATTESFGGPDRSSFALVELSLANGRKLVIPTHGMDVDAGRAESLAARILEARAVYRRAGVESQTLLQRGHRPHATWVRALRAREVVDWRTPAVPNDVLWRVIEDASASPVERAAAAVALGEKLAPGDRERLARAAHATVVPRLRVALESAVDAEDERLASMLEGLEDKQESKATNARSSKPTGGSSG